MDFGLLLGYISLLLICNWDWVGSIAKGVAMASKLSTTKAFWIDLQAYVFIYYSYPLLVLVGLVRWFNYNMLLYMYYVDTYILYWLYYQDWVDLDSRQAKLDDLFLRHYWMNLHMYKSLVFVKWESLIKRKFMFTNWPYCIIIEYMHGFCVITKDLIIMARLELSWHFQ